MIKNEFPPERIYNIDESAITTVHVPVKVVAGKGAKQVDSVTSGELWLTLQSYAESTQLVIQFPNDYFS